MTDYTWATILWLFCTLVCHLGYKRQKLNVETWFSQPFIMINDLFFLTISSEAYQIARKIFRKWKFRKKITFLYFYISAFCSLNDRPTYKKIINKCLYIRRICTEEITPLSLSGSEKIVYPCWADICNLKVALLLK